MNELAKAFIVVFAGVGVGATLLLEFQALNTTAAVVTVAVSLAAAVILPGRRRK
jgi:hypothetical protein